MGTMKEESRKKRRVLDAAHIHWISNTGRFVLRVLTAGRVSFPEADMASYRSELEKTKSFGSRLWITLRYIAMDSIYFPIGLVFWVAVFFFGLYMFVKLLGPIPSLHEWR